MTGVTYVINDEQVNAAINRIGEAGVATGPLMQDVANSMLFGVQRRFETESGPDGSKWQKLSPRTAKARIGKRRRGSENILRVRGRLLNSIVAQASNIEAATGTNIVYGKIHQLGGTIDVPERKKSIRLRKVKGRTRFAKRSHKRARDLDVTVGAHKITIPARPYLGFSDADRKRIIDLADDHFAQAVEARSK